MDNPFVFSGIVTGKKFCNRAREQDDLINYINASQNVLLFSNRRTGKTSLLHQVFSRLGKDIGRMYVDLYGTVTEQDFILSVMKNIGQLESRIDRLIKITREIFTSANISLSVDPVTGLPSLSPVFTAKSRVEIHWRDSKAHLGRTEYALIDELGLAAQENICAADSDFKEFSA